MKGRWIASALLVGLGLIEWGSVLAATSTTMAPAVHFPGMEIRPPSAKIPIQPPPAGGMPMLPVFSKTMLVPPPPAGAMMPIWMPAK